MSVLVKAIEGALVALVLGGVAVYALGSRLPAEHVASAAITVNAPQGRVWSLMEDIGAQTAWRSGLDRIEPMPDRDGHRCWVEVRRHTRVPLCEEVTGSPISRVVVVDDPHAHFGATWMYTLTALTPDTTNVNITEHATTRPALWRFLNHYVLHQDATVREYERDLKAAAEKQ